MVTQEELLDEIKKISEKLERPANSEDIIEHSNYAKSTFYRNFEGYTWNDIQEEAGILELDKSIEEEFRPTSLDGIVGQDTDKIQSLINGSATPNILLYGPPATGKTSTAKIVSEKISGDDYILFDESDDRGVEFVRNRLKRYTRTSTLNDNTRSIVLDEIEYMSEKAQGALRGVIEDSPAVFILTTNDIEKVDNAVISRCIDFKFGRLDTEEVQKRLTKIAPTTVDTEEIAEISEGDMRTALQLLQSKMTVV